MSDPLTAVEILTRARALVERPKNWTQGEIARDANGRPVLTSSPYATRFCIYGALGMVCEEGAMGDCDFDGAAEALRAAAGGTHPIGFNDTHTHAEVLALFDRAIEACRSEEPRP